MLEVKLKVKGQWVLELVTQWKYGQVKIYLLQTIFTLPRFVVQNYDCVDEKRGIKPTPKIVKN